MTITTTSVSRARLSRSRSRRDWWGSLGTGASFHCRRSARPRPGIPTWTRSTGDEVQTPWSLTDRSKLQVLCWYRRSVTNDVVWCLHLLPAPKVTITITLRIILYDHQYCSQRWRHGWTTWYLMRGRGWSTWKRWKQGRSSRAASTPKSKEPWKAMVFFVFNSTHLI